MLELASTIFYPSDGFSCEQAVALAATTKGICYIRTSEFGTPVTYDKKLKFKVGQAHILRQSVKDEVLLIGAGLTVNEAIKASVELEKLNIHARVIDPFTIKPLDLPAILSSLNSCQRRIVTVEDHQSKGRRNSEVFSF